MKTFRQLIESIESGDIKYDSYRKAIKDKFDIDINDFKNNKVSGGKGDKFKSKDITKFELKQILKGLEIEQEHTTDKLIALEVVLDHLEEFKKYYIPYLEDMEKLAKKGDSKKTKLDIAEETEFTNKQKEKISNFVKNYKGDFKDEDIHTFSDSLKLDKHEVEEYIYSIAREKLNEK
jgi:hypothetical protein